MIEHWKGCHNGDLARWLRVYGRKIEVQWLCWDGSLPLSKLEQTLIDRFQPLANKIRAERNENNCRDQGTNRLD